jgi:predicted transcriptional regulator
MTEQTKPTDLLNIVSGIVGAYLGNNNVPSTELPQLIRDIYQTFAAISAGEVGPKPRGDPAVPVRKSVTADFIVCLDCGKKGSMLKRHLRTAHGLSTEEYRRRWDLPGDYPMVAPNYARGRSRLARQIGLGTRPRRTKAARVRKTGFLRASR